jgi:hypothetical protein
LEDENGKLIAHGTVTSMALANLQIHGQDYLPPKFLD